MDQDRRCWFHGMVYFCLELWTAASNDVCLFISSSLWNSAFIYPRFIMLGGFTDVSGTEPYQQHSRSFRRSNPCSDVLMISPLIFPSNPSRPRCTSSRFKRFGFTQESILQSPNFPSCSASTISVDRSAPSLLQLCHRVCESFPRLTLHLGRPASRPLTLVPYIFYYTALWHSPLRRESRCLGGFLGRVVVAAAGSAAANSLYCHMSTNQLLRSQQIHLHTSFPSCEADDLSADSCLVFREECDVGLGEIAKPDQTDGFVRICYSICTCIRDTSRLVAILFRVDFWVSNIVTFGLYPPSRLMGGLVHCYRGWWFHDQLGFADASDVSFSLSDQYATIDHDVEGIMLLVAGR